MNVACMKMPKNSWNRRIHSESVQILASDPRILGISLSMKRQQALKTHRSSRISLNILSETHQNVVKQLYTGVIPEVYGDDSGQTDTRFFVP